MPSPLEHDPLYVGLRALLMRPNNANPRDILRFATTNNVIVDIYYGDEDAGAVLSVTSTEDLNGGSDEPASHTPAHLTATECRLLGTALILHADLNEGK